MESNVEEIDFEKADFEETDKDLIKTLSKIKDDEITKTQLEDEIKNYVEKINYDIGYYWCKKYAYAAFWSNVSTPINLAITIITALTTGQSASQNLISTALNTKLGITVLVLSIFNTFFRPHQQMTINQELTKKWMKLGTKFDTVYYNKVYNNKERAVKLKKLQILFDSVNLIKRDNDSNYLIDLIFLIIERTCIRNRLYWKIINNNNDDNNDDSENNDSENNFFEDRIFEKVAETIV